MKVIVFVDPIEGGTSIYYPNYAYKHVDETDDAFLTRCIDRHKSIPRGVTTHIMDSSDIPSDRYFRSAWEWSD